MLCLPFQLWLGTACATPPQVGSHANSDFHVPFTFLITAGRPMAIDREFVYIGLVVGLFSIDGTITFSQMLVSRQQNPYNRHYKYCKKFNNQLLSI